MVLQAKVKYVEAQLAQTKEQIAELIMQQQELESQNQLLENNLQTHHSLTQQPENTLLWKVAQKFELA